ELGCQSWILPPFLQPDALGISDGRRPRVGGPCPFVVKSCSGVQTWSSVKWPQRRLLPIWREEDELDVLSDVLRAVRLTGAVYFDIRARAPWVAETPATSRFRAKVMPEFEHVIAFHIIMDGWCWVYLTSDPDSAIRLEAGDAVIIAGGESHTMGTERSKPEDPDLTKFYRPSDRPLPFVFSELGGQGDPVNLVCGYFGCDARPFNPILDALPR